ncbi:MAG TPA: GNAT family N-acetyltransferase [Candidatus Nanopelagicales bacterium]|nr:GNAT family N-acetyltransferase [Candidatus Nanopelagicales bacterium]
MPVDRVALLRRLDRFLDAVPRASATSLDVGPLRAFLSRVDWPYYARPRPEVDLATAGSVSARDLASAAEALVTHGSPVAFEWVAQVVPSMSDAATEYGLDVTLHPMLILDRLLEPPTPAGVTVRRLADDDPALAAARVVAELAFAATSTGHVGPEQVRALLEGRDPAADEHARRRIRQGRNVTMVAEHDGQVVGSGTHQPLEDVTEIVGVAVLPTYRRRGIGALLTAALTRDAGEGGADVVMLTAGSDCAARVYEGIGFVRVGEAGEAVPPG